MKQFIAGPNEEDARLSRFVERVTSGLPQSLLYKAFRNKRIKVNGKRAEPLPAGKGNLRGRKHRRALQAAAPALPQRPHGRRKSH